MLKCVYDRVWNVWLYALVWICVWGIWPGRALAIDDNPWGHTLPPGLSELLENLHQKYGPDTIALLGRLLDTATRSGGLQTASVEVTGTETREDHTFLTFQVETGLILNSRLLSQTDQLGVLWTKIIARAFAAFNALEFPTDGVLISLRYHYKSYTNREELYEGIDQPGTEGKAKFYFPEESLQAFLKDEISAQELLAQATVLANDLPVILLLPAARTAR